MSKETTPMQELIDRLEDMIISARHAVDNPFLYSRKELAESKKQIIYTSACILEATELLESEKQMVVDAHANGIDDASKCINGKPFKTSEQYFKETYEQ